MGMTGQPFDTENDLRERLRHCREWLQTSLDPRLCESLRLYQAEVEARLRRLQRGTRG
jgi:hypothetical protein